MGDDNQTNASDGMKNRRRTNLSNDQLALTHEKAYLKDVLDVLGLEDVLVVIGHPIIMAPYVG